MSLLTKKNNTLTPEVQEETHIIHCKSVTLVSVRHIYTGNFSERTKAHSFVTPRTHRIRVEDTWDVGEHRKGKGAPVPASAHTTGPWWSLPWHCTSASLQWGHSASTQCSGTKGGHRELTDHAKKDHRKVIRHRQNFP